MIRKLAIIAFSVLLSSPWQVRASTDQPDYNLLNQIAACQSIACLTAHQPAIHNRIEWTVLYANWLLLKPSSREAARGLLENMPATDQEQMFMFTLPVWHKGATTSDEQLARLDDIYNEWPRLLSLAVLRWPEFLPAYIRYGKLAAQYLHTDYTDYEQKVCKKDRSGFDSAFHTLSAEDQALIRRFVFDPDGCQATFGIGADQPS